MNGTLQKHVYCYFHLQSVCSQSIALCSIKIKMLRLIYTNVNIVSIIEQKIHFLLCSKLQMACRFRKEIGNDYLQEMR